MYDSESKALTAIESQNSGGEARCDSGILYQVIRSLYWDQIKPTEPDIIRRLCELFPGMVGDDSGGVLRFFELKDHRAFKISEDCQGRRVLELVCVPLWFRGWIDPNDTSDYNFPIEVWEGVCHYSLCVLVTNNRRVSSEEAGRRGFRFKGGRYGMAKHMQGEVLKLYSLERPDIVCERCESFIESIQFYSLGRMCQLIQASIAGGVLRYEDNLLQPVVSCQLPSAALASRLLGCGSDQVSAREVVSFSELSAYLELLFEQEKAEQMPLSQLKKKLIANFQVVLNPARLGHVKLSETLRQVENFTVRVSGNDSFLCKNDYYYCPLTPSTVHSA